jgi:hypothetical protein
LTREKAFVHRGEIPAARRAGRRRLARARVERSAAGNAHAVEQALEGHVLATAEPIGTFER